MQMNGFTTPNLSRRSVYPNFGNTSPVAQVQAMKGAGGGVSPAHLSFPSASSSQQQGMLDDKTMGGLLGALMKNGNGIIDDSAGLGTLFGSDRVADNYSGISSGSGYLDYLNSMDIPDMGFNSAIDTGLFGSLGNWFGGLFGGGGIWF